MALHHCSQSALCCPQAAVPINVQTHSRLRLKTRNYAVASDDNLMKNPFSQTRQGGKPVVGERFHLATSIAFKSISKRSSKTMALTSMPTIAPATMQAASTLFTFGTAFVVPFYTVMILAPHAKWTRKLVESNLPYVVLGVLYLYLLSISWSPDTLQLMFASKYWLPELPGITRMFSSMLTVASAWIHLLAVDLYAGRQIYLDGLQHAVETRHSLVLCLLFCPVGILFHSITKALVQLWRRSNNEEVPDVAKLYS